MLLDAPVRQLPQQFIGEVKPGGRGGNGTIMPGKNRLVIFKILFIRRAFRGNLGG